MKLKLSRGVVIGLLVLFLLTATLVVVAARRILRPPEPREIAIAGEMEKAAEPRGEHHVKELETFKPALAAPTPGPGAARENGPLADWETRATTPQEETANRAPQPNFARPERSTPPKDTARQPRETGEQKRVEPEASTGPSVTSDDRYAVPLASPGVARADRWDANPARSGVIQVAADSTDGPPRRMDSQVPEKQTPAIEDRPQLAAGRGTIEPPRGYPDQTRTDLDPRQTRGARMAEPPNELAGPATPYPARDSRQGYPLAGREHPGYDRAAESEPMASRPSGYPGPGAGYARDDSLRRTEPQPSLGQNPLRNDGTYEVQPNDSYWTISQRVYGNGAYFRALAEVNRGKAARPDRLPPGLLINIPPITQLEKDYPDYCPRPNHREAIRNRAAGVASTVGYDGGRTYVVQEGDTLTSIARNELGKITRWAEIYQLNREQLGKDYDYLTPGMRLAMPPRESQPSDRTTRRGEESPPFTR